jgi:hypothetical protein
VKIMVLIPQLSPSDLKKIKDLWYNYSHGQLKY